MKRTNDDIFVDSNVILYAFDKASFKNNIVFNLIRRKPFISTQVVMESVNICIKKI